MSWRALACLIALLAAPAAWAQTRPYIGYTYPAGGQQGTTFQIRLGGQNLDDVNAVLVTGAGVSARVLEYYRRLNNQEIQLLNEQLKELKRATSAVASARAPMMSAEPPGMMSAMAPEKAAVGQGTDGATQPLIVKIEQRTREFVQTPACASISSLVLVEVTIVSEAEPGARELRLATPRGVSNPLAFHVGPLPEYSRKPMLTATLQVLGKESQALRKRPAAEAEVRVAVPCTVNGQVASGEMNRYRFEARQGQRLVISTHARQLIPYIADAVPGWFQPVLELRDARGRQLAFTDDYRFRPDPVMFFEVPKDGEYVLVITDALYRGREDFVYRVTVGEQPFVTSLFPLGKQVDASGTPQMKGWNLQGAALIPPARDAGPGLHRLVATRKRLVSNPVPFALDTLPDGFDREPNNTPAQAQPVTLPVVLNGRIDRADDWDVFQFQGRSNQLIVAEVQARRLDAPLDSVLKLTDAAGRLLAFNDDCEDLCAGVNTHHADSYFMVRLPADGTCCVHLGDTARQGGDAYGYRLRLSAPQPDFELRVVPSSLSLRAKSSAALSVYAIRKDGFAGPIKLTLNDPSAAFSAAPVTLSGTQTMVRLTIKTDLPMTREPVGLSIVGRARIGDREIMRAAVPAEDRMQAFLWRHLVPASDLKVLVFDTAVEPPPKRVARPRPPPAATTSAAEGMKVAAITKVTAATNASGNTNVPGAAASSSAGKPLFTKQQIAGRLRQLKLLFEEGLLTEEFYGSKVAECEAAQ